MTVTYEWDCETLNADGEIVDHHHGDRLRDVSWPATDRERLVLVRDDDVERLWAYVDESRMLPSHFSRLEADGKEYPTQFKVPQRFHREIAREACR